MPTWTIILLVCGAGLIGGAVNALMAHEGFFLPKMDSVADGRRIWRPGFIGNMLVGTVTAVVLAGLYSPLGSLTLSSSQVNSNYALTVGGLVGALLSGIGGARLLTQEVDRRFSDVTQEQLNKAVQEWIKTQRR